MGFLKFLFAGAFAFFAFVSCDDEEEEPVVPSSGNDDAYYAALASISSSDSAFTATEEGGSVRFKTEGGRVVINVDCGTGWTVEGTAEDLFTTVVNASTLTVSAGMNTVENDLSGTITFLTTTDKIKFATLTVIQNAYGAPEISVGTNEWNAPAVGALTIDIAVECSLDTYTAKSADKWLTVEQTDTGITLTAQENEDTEGRSTTVEVSCTDGYKSNSEVITVVQDPRAYITLESGAINLGVAGGTWSIGIESSFDVSVESSQSWVSAVIDGDNLVVTAQSNSGESRTAAITLTAGDGAENCAESQISVRQCSTAEMMLSYTVSDGTEVVLPLTGTVNCTVDWGDGSEEETVTSAGPSHTYAAAGNYNVAVGGTVTGLSSNTYSKSADNLVEVIQWGKTSLTTLQDAFRGCSQLRAVPADDYGAFENVTSCSYMFYGSALESVPAGLFQYAGEATNLYACFYNCTSLKTIPSGLFDACVSVSDFAFVLYGSSITAVPENLFANCTNATTFYAAFYNCTNLKEVGVGAFDNCSKVSRFDHTFYGCSSLTSIPEGMFAECPNVTTFEDCFANCSSLTAVPDGVFSGCEAVTTFKSVFLKCTSLKTIPAGLFEGCSICTTFNGAFQECNSLTALPDRLFKGCSKATDFEYAFANCRSVKSIGSEVFSGCSSVTSFKAFLMDDKNSCVLEEIPAGLFDACTEVTNFTDAFYGCVKLTEIPKGLFDHNTKVTNFSWVFAYNSSLETVPDKLFDNCPEVTTFAYLFNYCSKLKSIPAGLFDKNAKVTTFEGLCTICEGLESIPSGLFDNCPLVTDFTYVFQNAVSIEEIPAGLFDNCPEVTSFRNAFTNSAKLTSIPMGLFDSNPKVTDFHNAFYGCVDVTTESPYTMVNGQKVHLYERMDDAYKQYYPDVSSIDGSGCFTNDTNMTDYADIPSTWK